MHRSISRLHAGLLAVVFAGALGLGATQARAAPRESHAQYCNPELGVGDEYCNAYCLQQGALGGGCLIRYNQCACLYP